MIQSTITPDLRICLSKRRILQSLGNYWLNSYALAFGSVECCSSSIKVYHDAQIFIYYEGGTVAAPRLSVHPNQTLVHCTSISTLERMRSPKFFLIKDALHVTLQNWLGVCAQLLQRTIILCDGLTLHRSRFNASRHHKPDTQLRLRYTLA